MAAFVHAPVVCAFAVACAPPPMRRACGTAWRSRPPSVRPVSGYDGYGAALSRTVAAFPMHTLAVPASLRSSTVRRFAVGLLALMVALPGAGRAEPAESDAAAFLARTREHFASWDVDHDGVASLDEIDRAIASPAVVGEEAAALVALRRASRSKKFELPPLTPESIAGIVELPLREIDDDRDQANTLGQYYAHSLKRIRTADRALFASGSPKVDTFRQGRLGSCFSLAPLSAVMIRNPDDVTKMFRANSDGTYTVTFNDGQTSVTVTAPTDAELALSSTSGDDGVWPSVYEKAVGRLRAKPPAAGQPDPTPYSVVTKGGSAGTMLSTLTGRPIKRFSCSPFRAKPAMTAAETEAKLDELRALLTETFAAGRLATAGTPSKGKKVPSLSLGHAYAVLSYDSTTDRVTIRDPHGQTFAPKGEPGLADGYAVERGIWSAPLAEVVVFMGGFAFEQPAGGKVSNYATAATAAPSDTSD